MKVRLEYPRNEIIQFKDDIKLKQQDLNNFLLFFLFLIKPKYLN